MNFIGLFVFIKSRCSL